MSFKEFREQVKNIMQSVNQDKSVSLAEKLQQLESENIQLKNDNKILAMAVAEIAQTVYGGADND